MKTLDSQKKTLNYKILINLLNEFNVN